MCDITLCNGELARIHQLTFIKEKYPKLILEGGNCLPWLIAIQLYVWYIFIFVCVLIYYCYHSIHLVWGKDLYRHWLLSNLSIYYLNNKIFWIRNKIYIHCLHISDITTVYQVPLKKKFQNNCNFQLPKFKKNMLTIFHMGYFKISKMHLFIYLFIPMERNVQ